MAGSIMFINDVGHKSIMSGKLRPPPIEEFP